MRREARERAVFLDRDGTINVEREYLHRIEDFAFIPGVPAAIRQLKEAGFRVIVVTNQSGIGRGFFTDTTSFGSLSFNALRRLFAKSARLSFSRVARSAASPHSAQADATLPSFS